MKVLLCGTLVLLTILNAYAKGINIQIDSEDLFKIMDGVMNSQTFRNFASQLVQRGVAKNIGYNNPYHPEDNLVNKFDAVVEEEKQNLKKKTKYYYAPTPNLPNDDLDPLEKENEQFLNGNDVLSEDALTDNGDNGEGLKRIPLLKATNRTSDEIVASRLENSTVNDIEKKEQPADGIKQILTRKYKYDPDDLKPVQRRYVLKGSDDQPKAEVKA